MASLKKSARSQLRWLLLAPIPIAWCFIAHFGLLEFVENRVLDWRYRYRGPIDAPAKLAYVDVDSISIQTLGQFPWNRAYFADVASALIEHGGAKAVGMDFVFSEEGLPEAFDKKILISGNQALGRYLWRTPSVIVAASYSSATHRDESGVIRSRQFPYVFSHDLPPLRQIEPPETPLFNVGRSTPFAPPGVGLIDTVGGGVRFVPLYAQTSVKTYYTMGVEVGAHLLRRRHRRDKDQGRLARPREVRWNACGQHPHGGTPAARDQLVLLLARHRSQPPRELLRGVLAAAQLMKSDKENERKAGEDYFARPDVAKIFKDAVIMIGPVDKLLQDIAPTPMDESPEPRVAVHGNVFKTIISHAYLRRLPRGGGFVLIFCLSAVVTLLTLVGGARAVFAKALAVLSLAIYVAAAFLLFNLSHLVIPVVVPLGAAFTTSFIGLTWQIVEEQKQKGRIKGMFGTYVSPAVVESMVNSGDDPKLGGVEENITAYFSDIQSFSSFSEKLSPTLLVELMNQYLTVCTDSIQSGGGTLDKYIGDAVVAIYGAPVAMTDHAARACVAALEIHKRVGELRGRWIGEGDKWPEIVHKLQTRIGLNSGPAVVGNMGSTTRFSYTMMGDNVNIAARLESGAKSWGVYSMCTEATRTECERLDPGPRASSGRWVGSQSRRRTQPVPIYELAALRQDATDQLRECIALFEQGLARYYARDWDGAIALFRKSEVLEPNGVGRAPGSINNPSLVYTAIAEGYREEPPAPDWEGVYEMKEK